MYGFRKSSAGTLRRVLSRQTDHTVAPLCVGLRYRWRDYRRGWGWTRQSGPTSRWHLMAFDSFTNARRVDSVEPPITVEEPLARPFLPIAAAPRHCAVRRCRAVIARDRQPRPRTARKSAWITGIEHPHRVSGAGGARHHRVSVDWRPDSHRRTHRRHRRGGEPLPGTLIYVWKSGFRVRRRVNPSGGRVGPPTPLFAAGLERIGFAANISGTDRRGQSLARRNGPALQQNLVAVMEGRG